MWLSFLCWALALGSLIAAFVCVESFPNASPPSFLTYQRSPKGADEGGGLLIMCAFVVAAVLNVAGASCLHKAAWDRSGDTVGHSRLGHWRVRLLVSVSAWLFAFLLSLTVFYVAMGDAKWAIVFTAVFCAVGVLVYYRGLATD